MKKWGMPGMIILACLSCQSDLSTQEKVVQAIDNKAIMVDVTDHKVTLSGQISAPSDTIGLKEKILKIKGITEIEDNISPLPEPDNE